MGKESKDGCTPEQVAELVKMISQLPNLCLRGLMVIPAPGHTDAFEHTRQLFNQVRTFHAHPQVWDTLSMGMSADLEAAVVAGSTMVRIGTALFGTGIIQIKYNQHRNNYFQICRQFKMKLPYINQQFESDWRQSQPLSPESG